MSVLYFLEQLRNPFLDQVFSCITALGEETLFMVVAMVIFWCVNKYQGYYLFCVGFFGTLLNQFLKMVFRIPRPWWIHKDFTPVETAVDEATGYSFPSGHTQVSVGLYGGIARWNKQKWLRTVAVTLCVLIPLSRLYLGVHTPTDVLTSIAIALILVFGAYPLFQKISQHPRWMVGVLAVLALCVAGHIMFIEWFPFSPSAYPSVDEAQWLDARENGYTLLGCLLGMILTVIVDEKRTHFSVEAPWWVQILKTVGGLVLILGVMMGSEWLLGMMIPYPMVARVIKYFLTITAGGAVWPMTFRWFAKWGKREDG